MNKHKLTIMLTTLMVAVAIVACRKTDLQQSSAVTPPAVAVSQSQWKSVNSWQSSKQENFTIHYGRIADSAITSQIADQGLVLVYKNNGAEIITLPADEKGPKNAFWYYQVSQGTILINSDIYGADQTVDAKASFNYFVVSVEQLKSLQEKGFSKIDLMDLSYDKASTLLKN